MNAASLAAMKNNVKDFTKRMTEYGFFDSGSESVFSFNVNYFNPTTFTCLLALDDGNKMRTNRKNMFSFAYKNLAIGMAVQKSNVYVALAFTRHSVCSKKKSVLGNNKKSLKQLSINKGTFKKYEKANKHKMAKKCKKGKKGKKCRAKKNKKRRILKISSRDLQSVKGYSRILLSDLSSLLVIF